LISDNNTSQSLANVIFPTHANPNTPLSTAQHLAGRAFLVARSDTVVNLNEKLFISMNGEVFTLYSADDVVDDGDAESEISRQSTFKTFLHINTNSKSPHLSFCYAILAHLPDCAVEHAFVWPVLVGGLQNAR